MSKKRSTNFSEDEKSVFLDLIEEAKEDIASRCNDIRALLKTQKTWETLTTSFNALISQSRDESSLMTLWNNMKVAAGKSMVLFIICAAPT